MASFILKIFFQFANTNLHLIQYRFYYFFKIYIQKLNPETTATSNAGATASANATKTQPLEENEETDPSGQEEKLKR